MSDRGGSGAQAAQGGGTGQAPGNADGQGGQASSFSAQVFGPPAGQQQPQGGQQGQGGQAPGAQSGTGAQVRFDGMKDGETLEAYVTRVNSELREARQDAGKYRTQLRAVTGGTDDNQQGGQNQGGESPQLTELAKQVADLTRDLNAERQARKADTITTAVVDGLATAGAIHPGRSALLVDTKALVIGADGKPTGDSLKAAIDALGTEMPQLFNDVRGSGDGGAGNNGSGGPQDFNAMIRAKAGVKAS